MFTRQIGFAAAIPVFLAAISATAQPQVPTAAPQQPGVAAQRPKPPELPAVRKDQLDFVNVVLDPYTEAGRFRVGWEVKPKNVAHGVVFLDLVVAPKGEFSLWNQFIAQKVSTIGQPPQTVPGVLLRGTTSYPNITVGMEVELLVSGEVQISPTEKKAYSYSKKIIVGK